MKKRGVFGGLAIALMLGAEFGGGGEGFWGLDFGAVTYLNQGLFVYVGGQYFLNPTVSDYYTIPLRIRVGGVINNRDVSWGVSALTGIRFYPLVLRYEQDEEEDFAAGIGAYVSQNYWGNTFFAASEADASLALSLAPDAGGGYYTVYY